MKNLFLGTIFILCVIYVSCSDNVTVPVTGGITVTASKFKHLDPLNEGLYEAWVSFDTAKRDHNEEKFNSLGKFNVDAGGRPIDPANGGAVTFKFKKPYVFTDAKDAIITLEPPGDNDTTPGAIIIAGSVVQPVSNTIYAELTVEGEDAFGHAGHHFFPANGNFMLNTPTTPNDSDFNRGIWTCDTNGVSLFLNDSLLAIPDSIGWRYEGWIVDTVSVPYRYYSTGYFYNPYGADSDGEGNCASGISYDKPGQDWITPFCPDTLLQNLQAGRYQFWITLEPSIEFGAAFLQPFYLRLFQAYTIPLKLTKGQVIPGLLHNVAVYYLPSAAISITR